MPEGTKIIDNVVDIEMKQTDLITVDIESHKAMAINAAVAKHDYDYIHSIRITIHDLYNDERDC